MRETEIGIERFCWEIVDKKWEKFKFEANLGEFLGVKDWSKLHKVEKK
jgi:hypothetical protein